MTQQQTPRPAPNPMPAEPRQKHATRNMLLIITAVLIAALVAAVVIAGGADHGSPRASTPSSTPTTAETTPEINGHNVLSAALVIQAFQTAGLPVHNPRYNEAQCETLGCIELVTTDDLSIYVFADPTVDSSAQDALVAASDSQAFSSGNVVLSYLAARTPASLRPRYQAVLNALE